MSRPKSPKSSTQTGGKNGGGEFYPSVHSAHDLSYQPTVEDLGFPEHKKQRMEEHHNAYTSENRRGR